MLVSEIRFPSKVYTRGRSLNCTNAGLKSPLRGDVVSFGYESSLKSYAKHCAYCGKELLTDKEAKEIAAQIPLASGKELTSLLNFIYKDLLTRKDKIPQLTISKELIELSKKSPDLTGKELIAKYKKDKLTDIKELRLLEKPAIERFAAKLQRIKTKLPEDLQTSVGKMINNPPEHLETMLNRIIRIKYIYRNEGKKLPAEYLKLCDEALKEKIKNDNNLSLIKFIERSLKYTPEAMARQLVEPLKVTVEHIKPNSKKGGCAKSNFLPVCSECNGLRKDLAFIDWFALHPEIKTNIIKCLRELQKLIEKMSDPSESTKNYIKDVCQTLKKESQGQLNLEAQV